MVTKDMKWANRGKQMTIIRMMMMMIIVKTLHRIRECFGYVYEFNLNLMLH
jgi:hypothetical protein